MVDDDEDQGGYEDAGEIVMPFVVAASNGGPFDDDSFAAGFTCGCIWQLLKAGPAVLVETVPTALVPQLDLVAMHYGYRFTSISPERRPARDNWIWVTFQKAPADD